MPTCYWIGGGPSNRSGTWDATDVTVWATTSGGSTNPATPPTITDDVVFDQPGGYTVTVKGTSGAHLTCNNFTVTNPVADIVFFYGGTGGANSYLDINGSLSISQNCFITTFGNNTFNVSLTSTASGNSIYVGPGCLIGFGIAFIDITGSGSWTVSMDSTSTFGYLRPYNGTINFTSNCYITNVIAQGGVINLGAYTLQVNYWSVQPAVTINAGTSTIYFKARITGGLSTSFVGGGKTYNNVILENSFALANYGGAYEHILVYDNNTFNSLTINYPGYSTSYSPLSAAIGRIVLYANQTIGTLSIGSGSNINNRIFLLSENMGVTRTLTVNSYSGNNVDFRDIIMSGAASPIIVTNGGDCGGNTNITFPTPKTVYASFASGSKKWSDAIWATSSLGLANINNFPLAQDTVIIDNGSGNNLSQIRMDDSWSIGSLDASNRTDSLGLYLSATTTSYVILPVIYGNFTLGTGITDITNTNIHISPNGTLSFMGRNTTQNIKSNGVLYTVGLIAFNGLNQEIKLLDDLYAISQIYMGIGSGNTYSFPPLSGTHILNINSNTIRTRQISATNSSFTETLNLGTNGKIEVYSYEGTNSVNIGVYLLTNMTFLGTGKISYIDSYNNSIISSLDLQFTGTTSATLPYTVENITTGLNVLFYIPGATQATIDTIQNNNTTAGFIFQSGKTFKINNFNVNGTNATSRATITASSATAATLYKNTPNPVNCDYLNISNITCSGTGENNTGWYAGTDSVNGGGNTNWYFEDIPSFFTLLF